MSDVLTQNWSLTNVTQWKTVLPFCDFSSLYMLCHVNKFTNKQLKKHFDIRIKWCTCFGVNFKKTLKIYAKISLYFGYKIEKLSLIKLHDKLQPCQVEEHLRDVIVYNIYYVAKCGSWHFLLHWLKIVKYIYIYIYKYVKKYLINC